LSRNKPTASIATCPPKPALKRRPPITLSQAGDMESAFKVLGNATRLRLLHALVRKDELCVTDLANAVEMSPQAVSNQLQRLVDRGILGARRNGNRIHYRIVDRCVVELLDLGLCLTEDSKKRGRR
jgi:DNA-binding transcriptional ArsR family regulator